MFQKDLFKCSGLITRPARGYRIIKSPLKCRKITIIQISSQDNFNEGSEKMILRNKALSKCIKNDDMNDYFFPFMRQIAKQNIVYFCLYSITCRNYTSTSNFGDSFRWPSEYPWSWYIIEAKSKHFPTVLQKNRAKQKKKMRKTGIFTQNQFSTKSIFFT
ncbi:Uncharacterized protein FWK35_00007394 [Aphis craccivora]|uniref:Uncharacterized protein n=1 Tax=Aphis craccivora TaxID=307492 RepID=A0A6G0Z9Z1_APHCR|nr:Uncharacterized protein FWK35_00007394 [Aphis craccivora]